MKNCYLDNRLAESITMLTLKFLKAEYGDAILIQKLDSRTNKLTTILIDGGPQRSYQFKDSKSKTTDGVLKKTLDELQNQGNKIDLLIITHIDDDHIAGILKWLKSDIHATKNISKVWFNSGRLISEYFNEEDFLNDIEIKRKTTTDTSIKQGATFESIIEAADIWERRIIKAGDIITFVDMTFYILSPDEASLSKLLKKWEKEAPLSDTSQSTNSNYKKTLRELIETKQTCADDDDPHNGSSIAFVLQFEKTKIAFLADAHSDVVLRGLSTFGYTKDTPLEADLVKLSHHGSCRNISTNLVEVLGSQHYIISTDGSRHGHPDKETFAEILSFANDRETTFSFNYPEVSKEIFLEKDFEDFPNLKISELDKGIVINYGDR